MAPRAFQRWMRFIALDAIGDLKNVQAVACHAFLQGMHFRHQGGRDRRLSASAASESVLGPGNSVFYGSVSSAIASSALPPGQLIACVLSNGREASGATPRHADALCIERITRTREEIASISKTVSIDRVDAATGLARRLNESRSEAAIRGSVAQAATATLNYEP
jgi:hypothetical protein